MSRPIADTFNDHAAADIDRDTPVSGAINITSAPIDPQGHADMFASMMSGFLARSDDPASMGDFKSMGSGDGIEKPAE